MNNTTKRNGTVLLDEKGRLQFEIANQKEYERAQKLMDELLDVYSNQRTLIKMLSRSMQRWERGAPTTRLH